MKTDTVIDLSMQPLVVSLDHSVQRAFKEEVQ